MLVFNGLQFDLLCEQNAGHIWLKRGLREMLENYHEFVMHSCPTEIIKCLQELRERIDHEIENLVPPSVKYSTKISEYSGAHRCVIMNSSWLTFI